MDIIYFIAKTLVAIICVSFALLLLYLSFTARMFMVSLKELEDLLRKDLRKLLLRSSLGLNTALALVFRSAKAGNSPFSLLAYIIDMVRSR